MDTKYNKYCDKYNYTYNYPLNNDIILKGGNVQSHICEFNKELDIIIYHFTIDTLNKINDIKNPTTGMNITYYCVNNDKMIDTIFKDGIKQCNDKNILIIIDSILFTKNICAHINSFIEKIEKSDVLHNITIINYTNDSLKVIYDNEIFHKIVNVFPQNANIYTNDADFLGKRMQTNKNIQTLIDTNKKDIYKFSLKRNIEPIKITVRIMNIESKSKNLNDQWWFKWYFHIPPCANIRLSQSSGTCWLNSALNSLFLIDKISHLFKSKYETEIKNQNEEFGKISFNKFDDSKYELKNLIFSTIYHLIINKKKAKYSDNNFVGYLASKIKCEYNNKKNVKMCNELKYGEGGDAFSAISIICKYVLMESEYVCINVYNLLSDEYNKIVKKYNKQIKTQQKIVGEYNDLIKIANSNNSNYNSNYNSNNNINAKITELKTKFDEINKHIESLNKKITKSDKKMITNVKEFDIDNNSLFNKMGNPKILVFRNDFMTAKKKILFNGKFYNLVSGIISLKNKKEEHVICGFMCNAGGKENYYVYDSNNILVECDWYNGEKELKKYFNDDVTKEIYKKKNDFVDINCIVYHII